MQCTWLTVKNTTVGHGQPPYLVEQVDCSSEGKDEVDWLPVTVRQVGSHLQRRKA